MVEIIPKEAPKLAGWLNILFYFSLILLIAAISSLFIFNNSLKKSQKTLADLESALIKARAPEKINLEKEILKQQGKIENFLPLINQHLAISKIFPILEKNSHPKVWFSRFDLNSRQGSIKLSGEAQSFESLGQQILIFKEEKAIGSANLENVSITKEGKISFDLSLSFGLETLMSNE